VSAARDWPALQAARLRRVPRVPLYLGSDATPIGSVAGADLAALARWPQWLEVAADAVRLHPAADLDARLAELHAALRAQGRIRAWRDEPYTLWQPRTRAPLAVIERAAARFWGALTLGAHANGYVADASGRPVAVWVAQRAWTKPTDPGKFDNLIGGGVPHGQTPWQALLREGWEEAGLAAPALQRARRGRIVVLDADIAEGLQHEHLHVWDLPLPADAQPHNQDGEVAALHRLPVAEALALAASGQMTTDAALATLDFALRHRLLDAATHARLEAEAAGLWGGGAEGR
jgi:8-oxo-dGTP pyrophosphatase MutT (NUDIX family)